jgi:hypothetical protein
LAKAGNAIPRETFTALERISVKDGLPMGMEAIEGQELTSERIGHLMGVVDYRAPAKTLGKDGNETPRGTFTAQARTLGVDSRKTLKATYTEPERTLGKVGSMMKINQRWQ